MKSPSDYLAAALTPWPEPSPSEGIPHVKAADAQAAIGAALADAEKYYGLLLRAIRNSKSSPQTPELGTPTNG